MEGGAKESDGVLEIGGEVTGIWSLASPGGGEKPKGGCPPGGGTEGMNGGAPGAPMGGGTPDGNGD